MRSKETSVERALAGGDNHLGTPREAAEEGDNHRRATAEDGGWGKRAWSGVPGIAAGVSIPMIAKGEALGLR